MSFQFVFPRAFPVTGSVAGDMGGEVEAESEGTRERQAAKETAEGKGERDKVMEVEPSRLYLLRVSSSFPRKSHQPRPSCWPGRDGGARFLSQSEEQKGHK